MHTVRRDGQAANGVQDVTSFSAVSGFVSNFALGQLWLTNTTLELAQAVPTSALTNALFVNDLYLFGQRLFRDKE